MSSLDYWLWVWVWWRGTDTGSTTLSIVYSVVPTPPTLPTTCPLWYVGSTLITFIIIMYIMNAMMIDDDRVINDDQGEMR